MSLLNRIAIKIAREYIASEQDAICFQRKASPFRKNNIPMIQSDKESEKYHRYTFDCNDPIVRDAVIQELRNLSKQQKVINDETQKKINQKINLIQQSNKNESLFVQEFPIQQSIQNIIQILNKSLSDEDKKMTKKHILQTLV